MFRLPLCSPPVAPGGPSWQPLSPRDFLPLQERSDEVAGRSGEREPGEGTGRLGEGRQPHPANARVLLVPGGHRLREPRRRPGGRGGPAPRQRQPPPPRPHPAAPSPHPPAAAAVPRTGTFTWRRRSTASRPERKNCNTPTSAPAPHHAVARSAPSSTSRAASSCASVTTAGGVIAITSA